MRQIDADALKQTFCAECDHSIKCEDCDIDYHFEHLAPTIDPVKHGEWRYDEALELEWCSECGFGKRKGDKRWYSYCPNCGAYMEVKDGLERK